MNMSIFFRKICMTVAVAAGAFFVPALTASADTFDLPVSTVDGTYYESNIISGHCDTSSSGTWVYTSEEVDSDLIYNVATYLSAEYDLEYDDSIEYITYIYIDGSCVGIGTNPSGVYYCGYYNPINFNTIQNGVSQANIIHSINQGNGTYQAFYTPVDINTNGMYCAGFPEDIIGYMNRIYSPTANVVYKTRVTLTDLSISIFHTGGSSDVDLTEVITLLNQLINLTTLNNGNVAELVDNSQTIIELLEDLYDKGVDINSNVLNIYNILSQYLPLINGNLVDIESDVETLHVDLSLTNSQIATIVSILQHAYDTDSIETSTGDIDDINSEIDSVQTEYIADIGTYLDSGDYQSYLSVSGDAIAPYIGGIVWFRTCLDSIYNILPSGIQYVIILILFVGAFLGILGLVGRFRGDK